MQLKIKYPFLFALIFALSSCLNSFGQFYTGSHQTFGKSRVQYDDFIWQYYDFGRFQVYFYSEGNSLASYTAHQGGQELDKLEKLFDFELRDKVQFVVYNKMAHFRQSNVGLSDEEGEQLGGITRSAGTKVFLYFEGDHNKLNLQIREGLARIIIGKMMYGGNWKEVIKNSTLLNLPEWYVNGLISYTTHGWNIDIDSKVKDGILTGKFEKFNKLEGDDALYAGHSMWNYIGEIYGENVIPNILYMSRISRSIESGFLFVIGVSLKTLATDYLAYYKQKYESDESLRKDPSLEPLSIKSRKNRNYSQFKVSPSQEHATYVSNQLGQYKIWLYDLTKEKRKKIIKGEHKLNRIADKSFPVIAWHPTGKAFSYIIEKKGKILLNIYDLEKRKKNVREIFELEKVLDMNYSNDGTKMIFSGTRKGQSDLFLYHFLGNTQIQLTNDPYDDLNPRFINNSKDVIFSSNRINDSIKKKYDPFTLAKSFDLYKINIADPKNLKRITNTPDANETNPVEIGSRKYTYLSDANGVVNRYTARFDSTISHIDTSIHYRYFTHTNPNTNYSRNILEFDYSRVNEITSELHFKNDKYWFYLLNKDSSQLTKLTPTPYKLMALEKPTNDSIDQTGENDEGIITENKQIDNSNKLNIDNYIFEDEKPDYEKIVINLSEKGVKTNESKGVLINNDSTTLNGEEFEIPEQRIYYVNFATDYVSTQLGNNYLNAGYQRFRYGAFYNFPGLNGILKIGISDLFEDYKISGAVRLSRNFRDNEYLLSFEDLSTRLDKNYVFHRKTEDIVKLGGLPTKLITNQGFYILKWPFNEVTSIRGTLNARYDKEVFYTLESSLLKRPDILHYTGLGKLEFIFDNTIPRGVNLYTGLRFKIFGEYYQEFNNRNTDLMVFGFDARHYKKIYRKIIWANRIAGSTSLGNQRLIYYMGGVDGWFKPDFDYSIPIPSNLTFGYQTIATPMRGHLQNVRNGNNFALFNTELRVPIFQFLIKRPIKSDFVKNFQVIGFGDAGTAFTGWDPYSDENTFNSVTTVLEPITVITKRQINPIVAGFGFGLRSRIWGYFLRLDWAWPLDDLVQNKDRIFYLSLSHDF